MDIEKSDARKKLRQEQWRTSRRNILILFLLYI